MVHRALAEPADLDVEAIFLHVTHERQGAADRVRLGFALDGLGRLADCVVAWGVELARDALEWLASPTPQASAVSVTCVACFD
eukprot:COSAG01_NODE_6056_length_3876_cov_9.951019_8_plen_83_part_00